MGLAGLSKYRESQKAGGKFWKPTDKQKVKIRPLTELDFDANNYSNKNGLALFVTEFQHPNNYRLNFVDTTEAEGACVGFELANKFGWKKPEDPEELAAWQDWRPKQRLYLPVLLNDGENPESVVVLQLGLGPKQVQSNALITCHEDNGSIVDRWWSYSRKGSGQYDTTYSLSPLDKDTDLPDAEDYEVPDLNGFVNHVPYAEQRRYLGLDRPVVAAQGAAAASDGETPSLDVEW